MFVDHPDEATVVVFGPTQVGKTTLILELLGVRPEHIDRVTGLLRGGRPAGRSATSTAMQYTRSPDESWYLGGAGQERILDDQGMEAALADLRRDIETGRWTAKTSLLVRVPARYLLDRSANFPTIRLIDLPGDNPADEVEAGHVRVLSKHYVPLADLVLLVTRADRLGFFDADTMEETGIGRWRYTPRRFRLVTTYTFSPQTMIDWAHKQIAAGLDISLTTVREEIAKESKTYDSLSDSNLHDLLCPLEIGNSWSTLRGSHPDLYARVEPIAAEMKMRLLSDIAAASDPLGRIRQASDTYADVRRLKDDVSNRRNTQTRMLLSTARYHQDRYRRSLRLMIKAKQSVADCDPDPDVSHGLSEIRAHLRAMPVRQPGETVASFRRTIDTFIEVLLKTAHQQSEALSASEQLDGHDPLERQRTKLRDIADESFAGLRKKVDGYFFDTYYPSISGDYSADCTLFSTCCEAAIGGVAAHVENVWIANVKRICTERESHRRKRQHRYKTIQKVARARRYRLREARMELHVYRAKTPEILDGLEADIRHGLAFRDHMDGFFLEQLQNHRRDIEVAPSPASRLLHLLGAVAACDQRRKLMMD